MAALTGLITAVSEPSGLWAIIINVFENGVGSYILAVLLLTLLIRVVWAPVDTLNKKFNKKMVRNQAKLQPQMEKLEKQYAKDPALLNRKKQELYKKANAGLGGGCLFMIIFLALNLTIFGSMFTTMNAFSSYKVYNQYEDLKYSYANVLSVLEQERIKDNTVFETILDNCTTVEVIVENNEIYLKNGEFTTTKYPYSTNFIENEGTEYEVSSTAHIANIIKTYITDDGNTETLYFGDNETANKTKYSTAMQTIAMNYVNKEYEKVKSENTFLWIGNIWVADSPFKQSVLSYGDYKGMVGESNVDVNNEELVYNSFMNTIKENYNATNGYFILAVISIGVTYLSLFFANGISKKKQQPQVKQNKAMNIIMPLIMGVFAIMYNSVFAFYLVVSQAINVLLTPLENIIIDKWEARDMKKEEEKNIVEYSRKKI